jgi:uncharacterized membrane protein
VVRVVEAVVIAGDIEEVFAITAEPGTMARWQRGVSGVRRLEGGPVGLGSRLAGVRGYAGMRVGWTSVITAWEPPWRLAFRSAGGPVRLRGEQRFAPVAGGTQVTATLEADVGVLGLLGLDDKVRERVATELRGDLAALKRLIEGQEHQG